MTAELGRMGIVNGYVGVWRVEAVMGGKLVMRLDGHRITVDRADVIFLDDGA